MKLYILNITFYTNIDDKDSEEYEWDESYSFLSRRDAISAMSMFVLPFVQNNSDNAYEIMFNPIEGEVYIAIPNYDGERCGMWVLNIDEAYTIDIN